MNVIKFGKGDKNLVIVSGVSLCGLEGMGAVVAASYKILLDDFTIYLFDRKKVLPEGYTVENMADDIYCVCRQLEITDPYFYGVSQGGMIAQIIAISHPEYVKKLVLCSTLSRASETFRKCIDEWIDFGKSHDIVGLNRCFFNNVYSDGFLERNSNALKTVEKKGTREDAERFVIMVRACRNFDVYDRLGSIKCPVFVIGDMNDKIIGPESMKEIAERLGCGIYMYDTYSHAVFDEAPDIKDRIKEFLLD